MPKPTPGAILPPLVLQTLRGEPLALPAGGPELLHLQFRRFAGCPICSTHLRGFVRRADELKAAGVREVIFFHSSAAELEKHQADLPFDVIPDPTKKHYRAFGVETSPLAALHPSVWWAGLRGVLRGKIGLKMENGPLGLPADFLVSPSGVVLAVKYGTHAYDQWSVDETLAAAARARAIA